MSVLLITGAKIKLQQFYFHLWEMIANVYRSLTLYKVCVAGPRVSGRAERNGEGGKEYSIAGQKCFV